jgi:hypothetical protein
MSTQASGEARGRKLGRLFSTHVRFSTVNRNPTENIYMPKCETCGNDYDKAFEVIMAGKSHAFDSFECAIHALAPTCPH